MKRVAQSLFDKFLNDNYNRPFILFSVQRSSYG